jgi:class I fructose-bisphosphate aldolase/fructose-bisphosphate aldolase/2-amino-3,7-dideoxy-D-threo-hept-6-ulosonate synthase
VKLIGKIVDEASRYSLPVLAMVYDKVNSDIDKSTQRMRQLIRIVTELGCDMVKIAPTSQLPEILSDISEDIDVFVAGGSVDSELSLIPLVQSLVASNGKGLCVGRHVFQRADFDSLLTKLKITLTTDFKEEISRAYELH